MDVLDEEEDLEYRIMNLDFDAKKFTELEHLQIIGRLEEVGEIVGKHLDNEHLMQYITRFRKQQVFIIFSTSS